MSFCINCGQRLAEGAKFCASCGKRVEEASSQNETSCDVEMTTSVILHGTPHGFTDHMLFLSHLHKTVTIHIPNDLPKGQSLRIKGLGRVTADGKCGDLLLHFDYLEYQTNKTTDTPHKEDYSKRQTVYEGRIHQCPHCHETINSFMTHCPACGVELRDKPSTSVVNQFAQEIQKVVSDDKKEELIRNFYVPNTKEDIIEFNILAAANIETNSSISEAWLSKLKQTYQKAKFTFGNLSEFEQVEKSYNNAIKKYRRNKTSSNLKRFFHLLGKVFSVFFQAITSVFEGLFSLLKIIFSKKETAEIFMIIFLVIFLFGFIFFMLNSL